MTNNDFFRAFLHLTGLQRNPALVLALFAKGGQEISSSRLRSLRSLPDSTHFKAMHDSELNAFLDGLFKIRDYQLEMGEPIFRFPERLDLLPETTNGKSGSSSLLALGDELYQPDIPHRRGGNDL